MSSSRSWPGGHPGARRRRQAGPRPRQQVGQAPRRRGRAGRMWSASSGRRASTTGANGTPVSTDRQAPDRTWNPSPTASWATRCANAVLPTPASPPSSTSVGSPAAVWSSTRADARPPRRRARRRPAPRPSAPPLIGSRQTGAGAGWSWSSLLMVVTRVAGLGPCRPRLLPADPTPPRYAGGPTDCPASLDVVISSVCGVPACGPGGAGGHGRRRRRCAQRDRRAQVRVHAVLLVATRKTVAVSAHRHMGGFPYLADGVPLTCDG